MTLMVFSLVSPTFMVGSCFNSSSSRRVVVNFVDYYSLLQINI